jgi:hypothetical protein
MRFRGFEGTSTLTLPSKETGPFLSRFAGEGLKTYSAASSRPSARNAAWAS